LNNINNACGYLTCIAPARVRLCLFEFPLKNNLIPKMYKFHLMQQTEPQMYSMTQIL